MIRSLIQFALIGFVATAASLAFADQPVTTDSRIKTLVYSPNEVFNLTTHYGYQSNIEFGEKESIETISMGDRVAWQVSPAGRRLFIRAQEENAHTNMTVVTNLRAYQFDLRSSSADAVFGSEELTYVVRFYYPEDAAAGRPMPTISATAAVSPTLYTTSAVSAAAPTIASAFNYHYTYSGNSAIAPLKIFDDGKATYFKFASNIRPQIAIIASSGETVPVSTRHTPDGLVAVSAIAPRFSISQNTDQVIVYNESGGVR